MFNLIGLLLVGLIIGVLARLIKPGRQRLSLLATLAPSGEAGRRAFARRAT